MGDGENLFASLRENSDIYSSKELQNIVFLISSLKIDNVGLSPIVVTLTVTGMCLRSGVLYINP